MIFDEAAAEVLDGQSGITKGSGKVSCKGPYIQATAAEQEAFLKAGTSLELAKAELKKLEDAKPAVSEAGSEGAVTQKLLVYLVLWASVFLSYVYQPRARPLEPSQGR